MQEITLQKIHTAFQIYPSHAQQLTCRGILPEHPKGKATSGYILALADYIKTRRGEIPEAGIKLLNRFEGGKGR